MSGRHSDALFAASTPWVFTQEAPLTTSEFCKEAQRRRISLREEQLPELWRVGVLAPFLEIRTKPVGSPSTSMVEEPTAVGTLLAELRHARSEGRLADPAVIGYRPQVRFFRNAAAPRKFGWWNGLLYSRWQLLGLNELSPILGGGRWRREGTRLKWRSPSLTAHASERASRQRRITALITALDGRYLPVIERRWINLTNADATDWDSFTRNFDAEGILAGLDASPDDLLHAADNLLLWLDRIDPHGNEWSELVRRAPRRSWHGLSGEALVALDHRIAAEVLLRCYEDLSERGLGAPLSDRTDAFHAERQRISYRSQPLDANLSALGLSPHPGVVLVVEGETEEVLLPLVRDHIEVPSSAEMLQAVVMRGTHKDLTKLAAFASAPLIDRQQADTWLLVKPPTRIHVLVDPDPPFDQPEAERQKILDEIVAVVRAQGVDPVRADLDTLVTVKTWTASCFEFAHFTDGELARALLDLHPNCGGLEVAALEAALAIHRDHRQDIKAVWKSWRPDVRKPELARRLWPTLSAKLDAAAADPAEPAPEVAVALITAYHEAARRPRGQFGLRGTSTQSTSSHRLL